jgi:hypothetical protein
VSVLSELENISLSLPSIYDYVAAIRANVSRISTNISAIRTQVAAFSAIDTPLLGHGNIGRKTNQPGQ